MGTCSGPVRWIERKLVQPCLRPQFTETEVIKMRLAVWTCLAGLALPIYIALDVYLYKAIISGSIGVSMLPMISAALVIFVATLIPYFALRWYKSFSPMIFLLTAACIGGLGMELIAGIDTTGLSFLYLAGVIVMGRLYLQKRRFYFLTAWVALQTFGCTLLRTFQKRVMPYARYYGCDNWYPYRANNVAENLVTTVVPVVILAWFINTFQLMINKRDTQLEAMNKTLEAKVRRLELTEGVISDLINNILPEDVALELMDFLEERVGEEADRTLQLSTVLEPPGCTPDGPTAPVDQVGFHVSPPPCTKAYPNAAVMFADIVGFTTLSAPVTPAAVVEGLNAVFCGVDRSLRGSGVEKIKTIGDCYMAVSIPERMGVSGAEAAGSLINFTKKLHDWVVNPACTIGGKPLQVRSGIDMGPVLTGVIGLSKYAWDLWGDTVNTASRMESSGRPGEIHVSAAVERIARRAYQFGPPVHILVKGKGEMTTYFLSPTWANPQQPAPFSPNLPPPLPNIDDGRAGRSPSLTLGALRTASSGKFTLDESEGSNPLCTLTS